MHSSNSNVILHATIMLQASCNHNIAGLLLIRGRDLGQSSATCSNQPDHRDFPADELLLRREPRPTPLPVCSCSRQAAQETRPMSGGAPGFTELLSTWITCVFPQVSHLFWSAASKATEGKPARDGKKVEKRRFSSTNVFSFRWSTVSRRV